MGNSLVVQWLGLHAFTADGLGSFLGWGTNPTSCVAQEKKKGCHRLCGQFVKLQLALAPPF